ncbi:MAG TPA: FecR domain-containing protein [Verrucomicrobiae bacterium]|nr:FecR domain-containing protein [Verrucomicrobiae bacterium]
MAPDYKQSPSGRKLMKLLRPSFSGLVATGIAFAVMASLSASAADLGVAKVVNVHGAARYMTSDNSSWRPLKSGTILHSGAVIQTASDSYVDVVLHNPDARMGGNAGATSSIVPISTRNMGGIGQQAEQDAIHIYQNTVLGVDKLLVNQTGADTVTDTELDLKAGKILGTVKKLSAASRYEVKIPNGVAGIRGTIYTLSSDGILSVLSGSVVESYVAQDGSVNPVEVPEGQQYNPATGQVTPIPQSELNAMLRVLTELGIGPTTPETVFTVDHTVYFVSPTHGRTEEAFETFGAEGAFSSGAGLVSVGSVAMGSK